MAQDVAASLGCVIEAAAQAGRSRPDVVIVDDPSPVHARSSATRARRLGIPVVCISNGGTPVTPADLVVDGRVDASSSASTARLSGARYCIIDSRVRRARRHRTSRRPRVLMALGGGEHVRRVATRLVAALAARCPDAEICVAAGLMPGRLPRLVGGRWIVQRDGLTGWLASSDVVVAGGGITLQEACALGVPTVGMAVVAAQRPAIAALARRGAIVDGGGPGGGRATAGRVAEAVESFIASKELRRRMSVRGRRAIDGLGVTRVARAIERLARQQGRGDRG
jgi:spore coat polysaccharide biosynthesis predicted glycosyltransferase SpsG